MLKEFFRLFKILGIISKYQLFQPRNRFQKIFWDGFSILLSPIYYFRKQKLDFGSRLCIAMQELGPIYIKFGQILSTRPDVVGLEIAKSLESLQDKLPQSNFEKIENILTQELGDWREYFSEFNEKAVSAASIAEVYKAKLKTGEEVAVKVLKPGIEEDYKKDIFLFHFCAKWINKLFKKLKRFNFSEIVQIFEKSMKIELNLKFEAASCSEIFERNEDMDVIIPKIYWDFTTSKVLVLEWVDGVSIQKIDKFPHIDKIKLAQRIALCFFNQAFRDGFFHADLHPGNILVTQDGKIAFIDFGIMGRLSEKDRFAVAAILHGFLNREYKAVADLHLEVGYVPKGTDSDLFSLACRSIGEPIIGLPVNKISIGKLLGDLFYINDFFQMELQPQLLLLQKNMVIVEGIGNILDKDINMWNLIQPWIKSWAIHNITPEAKLIRSFKKLLHERLWL